MNRNRLYKQLKEDEGEVCQVYRDHLGYLTFGIGHLITQKDPEADWPLGTPVDENVSTGTLKLLLLKSNF